MNSEAAKKWGLPDWRDNAAYPLDRLVTEWRWEFLRRRPDYRNEWIKRSVLGVHPSLDPLKSFEDGNGEVVDPDGPAYCYAEDVDIARLQFGVSVIYDPAWRGPPYIGFFTDTTAGITTGRIASSAVMGGAFLERMQRERNTHGLVEAEQVRLERVEKYEKDFGIVKYVFDLKRPLLPQIKVAQTKLLKKQKRELGTKNTDRPRTENWSLFLRVLDAIDCGASYSEIATANFFNTKNRTPQAVRDTYNLACTLRDKFRR